MEVHAIEKNPKACDLIKRNTAKFHLHNIRIHLGMAGEIIKSLPVPTHIFIGGSGGELKNIFTTIKNIKSHVRVVTACVTLENFHQAYELMKDAENFEFTQISVISKFSSAQIWQGKMNFFYKDVLQNFWIKISLRFQ